MSKQQNYHFIGIGGIGMSGLARILLKQGQHVSGTDITSSSVVEELSRAGATIHIGHNAKHVPHDSIVVYTSDLKEDNPELVEAKRRKALLWHRSDLLASLMTDKKVIAIAGTHGKTTTTALITHVLKEAKYDPSYAIGGISSNLDNNADEGKGIYFIAEADESDGTFLKYHPECAVITNIDLDHMNYFHTEQELINAFQQFASQVKSDLFWCGEDTRLKNLNLEGYSYGFSPNNHLVIRDWSQKEWTITFDISFKDQSYRKISLNLIGKHNVLNATAVFGLCITLGIPETVIRHAFLSFKGIKRRCEKKAEDKGILILDDYAHHPTEIKTTLSGIKKAIGNRRLIVAYQPHRYTRTRDSLGLYTDTFDAADHLILTEIYSAGENLIPEITHETLLKEISQNRQAEYVPRDQLVSFLREFLKQGDVLVTLGAGDITKVGSLIL